MRCYLEEVDSMGMQRCAVKYCAYNFGSRCIASDECDGFSPADCLRCIWEVACDWEPDECHYVEDLEEAAHG